MILLVGASGSLGGMIVRKLLDEGFDTRVLWRSAVRSDRSLNQPASSSLEGLIEAGARPVYGDLRDSATLMKACRGADIVITTASAAFRGREDTVEAVDHLGNRNLIDAARGNGVGRFIFVSNYFSNPASPLPILSAKALTEQYLQASGLPYVILAPTGFMESWLIPLLARPAIERRQAILIGRGSRPHSLISMQDVANFAVSALHKIEAVNKKVPLGGPFAFTMEEALGMYESVMGEKIARRYVHAGEILPDLPQDAWSFTMFLDLVSSEIDMTEIARLYKVSLTHLEAFVRRSLSGEMRKH